MTVYGIETQHTVQRPLYLDQLQQYLPFTVCDEGCEAAEEQRDDEVRTSLVPDRKEGKTEVIKKQHLPFMVCDDAVLVVLTYNYISIIKRAVLSVCITEAQLFHCTPNRHD